MVFNNTVHQRFAYERHRLFFGKVFLRYSGANKIQLSREVSHKSFTGINVLQGRVVQSILLQVMLTHPQIEVINTTEI